MMRTLMCEKVSAKKATIIQNQHICMIDTSEIKGEYYERPIVESGSVCCPPSGGTAIGRLSIPVPDSTPKRSQYSDDP